MESSFVQHFIKILSTMEMFLLNIKTPKQSVTAFGLQQAIFALQ